MSLPYESNTTDWTKIRCIKAWIEYPFADDGDTTSKIYKMLCMCKNASYSAPAFSDVMSSATVAKLVSLPFTADSNAYFVGDSDFQPSDGGTIQFVRSFAPVPSTRSRAIGSYVYTFPAFRRWTDFTDTGDTFNQARSNHNGLNNPSTYDSCYKNPEIIKDQKMPPEVILRDPLTSETYAKITYTFVYATDQKNVTPDAIWHPMHPDTAPAGDSDYFWNFLGEKTGANPYEDADPYLYDESNGQTINSVSPLTSNVTIDKSSPSKTDYFDNYIDQEYINVESSIKSWAGNIYVKETLSVLAK